jgi:5-methyltetrahydrofolate--homocysteine methyltransferase
MNHSDSNSSVLKLLQAYQVGRPKRYEKGDTLYWQGERAQALYVITKGSIKSIYLSKDGRAHTFEILGVGRTLGLNECLLGGAYESTAEILEPTQVHVIPLRDFHQLLASEPTFSAAIMKEQARAVRSLSGKVRDLSLLDVQERLKHGLLKLAEEHGLVTEEGVRIDVPITHNDLAELIAANRTTITLYLKELEKQGYVWKENRRLFIVRPEHIVVLDGLSQAVLEADNEAAANWARQVIEQDVSPFRALDVLTAAMRQVDRGFERGTLALPDIVGSAVAMKDAMPIIDAAIKRTGIEVGPIGTVVIGTVRGDVHDIGKIMASMLLRSAGFRIIDLGVDVPTLRFVEAVAEYKPAILAMSSLMTTTAPAHGAVIAVLEKEGLRRGVKVIVGGGSMNESLADRIGADGYKPTARGAVELATSLTSKNVTLW